MQKRDPLQETLSGVGEGRCLNGFFGRTVEKSTEGAGFPYLAWDVRDHLHANVSNCHLKRGFFRRGRNNNRGEKVNGRQGGICPEL